MVLELEQEVYKYLGINKRQGIWHAKTKEKFRKVCFWQVEPIKLWIKCIKINLKLLPPPPVTNSHGCITLFQFNKLESG